MKKDKAKQRKLYDTIGILCGVVVIMLGVLSNVLAPKTPAGTVLAVADAEHMGKAVAKQVETMSGVTVMHAADWEKD